MDVLSLLSFVVLCVVIELVIRYTGSAGEWQLAKTRHEYTKAGRIPNPFMNHTPVNHFRLRYIWPGVFLLPLRMSLAVATLISIMLCGGIGVLVVGKKALQSPLKGWRRLPVWIVRKHMRLLLWSFGFLWIKRTGHPVGKEGARIVVANHRGMFEAWYLLQFEVTMLSNLENKFPGLGSAMDLLQFMFVSKKDPDSRKKIIQLIDERSKNAGWPQVMLFPEGCVTNGLALCQFKMGAFKPGQTVLPVAFEFPHDTVDVDPSWTYGVHGPMFGIFTTCARLMSSWSNPMTVHFLPPHKPDAAELKDASVFAENVRRDIGQVLRIPCTEHGQEDVMLMMEAVKKKLPPHEFATSGFGQLRTYYNMDAGKAKKILQRFTEVAGKDGNIDKRRFASELGLPDGPAFNYIFKTLSSDEHSEYINFREWITGVAKVSHMLSSEERAGVCFDAFDIDRDGAVTRLELFIMLKLGFRDVTQAQADDLWDKIARHGGDSPPGGPPTVTRAAFVSFLRENTEWQLLFDLLSSEAAISTELLGPRSGPPKADSGLPVSRHESYVRRRDLLRGGDTGAAAAPTTPLTVDPVTA